MTFAWPAQIARFSFPLVHNGSACSIFHVSNDFRLKPPSPHPSLSPVYTHRRSRCRCNHTALAVSWSLMINSPWRERDGDGWIKFGRATLSGASFGKLKSFNPKYIPDRPSPRSRNYLRCSTFDARNLLHLSFSPPSPSFSFLSFLHDISPPLGRNFASYGAFKLGQRFYYIGWMVSN